MNPYLRWTLRVVAQFVVAGGLIRALDAWIVHLDDPWQFTILAAMQLAVAFANAFLAGPEPGARDRASAQRPVRPRIRRPRQVAPASARPLVPETVDDGPGMRERVGP